MNWNDSDVEESTYYNKWCSGLNPGDPDSDDDSIGDGDILWIDGEAVSNWVWDTVI